MTDEITMERTLERQKRAVESAKKEDEKKLVDIGTVEILLKNAGIQVPQDFKKNVGETPGFIQKRDIRELFKITKFWKPYVGEKNYNVFVILVFTKFLRIHAVAINNNPNCEGLYIGDKAKLEGKPLMTELVTTALSSGGNASFIHTSSRWSFED